MRSRIAPSPRGGLLRRLLPCALVLAACGDDSEPPEACGSIPQLTIHAGESATTMACFNDPNGDRLTYTATTSDADVATASASGNSITVTGVAPGNATVAVRATDPGGLAGSLSFRVMVPNRAPLVRGTIPSFNVPVGTIDSLDVSFFFHEPDGQSLAYEAFSPDRSVVDASLNGSVVTLQATGAGTAVVVITATDPGGLSATQPAMVNVHEPEERFRDDFNTSASLTKWLLSNATAAVSQGRLELTSTDVVGVAERSVSAPLAPWSISVSMGRREAGGNSVGVWWLTGNSRYTICAFEIGPDLANNYGFYIFDSVEQTLFRISDFSGASDAVKEGAGELTEIELSVSEGQFRGVAGTTELFNGELLGFTGELLRELTTIALVSREAPNTTALFDWIEVDGTPASVPVPDRAAPGTPQFDEFRSLWTNPEFKVVDVKLSDLFGPGG